MQSTRKRANKSDQQMIALQNELVAGQSCFRRACPTESGEGRGGETRRLDGQEWPSSTDIDQTPASASRYRVVDVEVRRNCLAMSAGDWPDCKAKNYVTIGGHADVDTNRVLSIVC